MTPQQLQRFVVRMLWDPSLVDRVYGGRPVEGLDDASRALLTRGDKRAWDTDPYRRARTLQALIEEFPATVAEVGAQGLEAFFGHRLFHDPVHFGSPIAVGFGLWLRAFRGASPVAHIEIDLATARRSLRRPAPARGQLVCPSDTQPRALPEGTLARWEATRREVGPDPVPKLVAGFRAPPPEASRATEYLIVQVRGADAVLPGSEGVNALLDRAEKPRGRADLVRLARKFGASAAEAEEILDELVAEGLLVAG